MTTISPGLAQAGFELLQLIGVQGLTGPQVLAGLERIGGMAAAQVLDLTQTLNWIALGEDGLLAASPSGVRLLSLAGYEAMMTQALLDFAEVVSPPWLQGATSGRARVLSFVDVGVRQMIVEAGLAEGADERVVVFWDTLAALARGRRDDRLLAIGRHGERLSIAHELGRTGFAPRWVAIDSNEDGFDILSVAGPEDRTSIAIEVKASTLGLRGGAQITRGEWDTALSGTPYVFHFWDLGSEVGPRLAVVTAAELRDHIPTDQGQGRWDGVFVPFATFSARFCALNASP